MLTKASSKSILAEHLEELSGTVWSRETSRIVKFPQYAPAGPSFRRHDSPTATKNGPPPSGCGASKTSRGCCDVAMLLRQHCGVVATTQDGSRKKRTPAENPPAKSTPTTQSGGKTAAQATLTDGPTEKKRSWPGRLPLPDCPEPWPKPGRQRRIPLTDPTRRIWVLLRNSPRPPFHLLSPGLLFFFTNFFFQRGSR